MGFQLEENKKYNAQYLIDMLNNKTYRTVDKEKDFTGVYKIENLCSGKVYIGSAAGATSGIKGRWYEHLFSLNKKQHHSFHLQNAWNLYRASSFEFSVVERIDLDYNNIEKTKQEIRKREQYFFEVYDVFKNGYNTSKEALGGGWILTEEWIKNGKSKQLSWEQYLYVKDKLINTSLPLSEISKKCGCSKSIVKQIYERKILQESFKDEVFPKRRIKGLAKLSEIEKENMCQEYLKSASIKSVAKEYGLSPFTVALFLEEKGIKNNGSFDYDSQKSGKSFFVYQYTLDGEYIRSFDSMTEAAKSCGSNSCSKIVSCCKGKRNSSYGYCWSYEKMKHLPERSLEEQILGMPISSRLRPIIQYNLDWEPIKLFPSLRSTGKEVGSKPTDYLTIARNMKLNLNDTETFGYKWKYSDLAPKDDLYKLLELKG